ncbi:MAG: hypothetical protein JSS81_08440 [Acidobacteria bacterium]|nr:hypothetical protein [Acidobacteriota bacterium]
MKLNVLISLPGLFLIFTSVSALIASAPVAMTGGPDELPPEFSNAGARLFELGLPDPRGLEYRELEIKSNSVWGGSSNFKIHGWLLPAADPKGPRFGIGWNGVRFPLLSVGEKADLTADIRAALEKDEKMRADQKKANPDFPFYRFDSATPYMLSAAPEGLFPLRAVMLEKLGETKLAAEVWTAYATGLQISADEKKKHPDPFLYLAGHWTWALFDAAVNAHLAGDDADSLRYALELREIGGKVETEAAARGFKLADGPADQNRRYLDFLRPLDSLIADEQRRLDRKGNRADLDEISKIKDRTKRIAALVDRLDEIDAHQWGQPGGVSLGDDPIVAALVREGEPAVEALLKTLETDERLTRSVSFHRDFFRGRHLIPVADGAYIALTLILKTDVFGTPPVPTDTSTPEKRRALAAQIRAYYAKFAGKTPAERWYGALADDAASVEEWLQAAANIVAPQGKWNVAPDWAFTQAPVPAERAARGIVLQGAELSGKKSPPVAELLLRRMRELAARPDEKWPHRNLLAAADLGLALLAWEGRAHAPDVAALQAEIKKRLAGITDDPNNYAVQLRGALVNLYVKRIEAGDAAAFDEYAEWGEALRPLVKEEWSVFYREPAGVFRPLWRYPDNPRMRALAGRLFATPGSRWLPLVDPNDRESYFRGRLIGSPLLNVREFRALVLAGLADRTVIGKLTPSPRVDGRYDLKPDNPYAMLVAGSYNSSQIWFDAPAVLAGADLEIRVCDVYAAALARVNDAPRFGIAAPRADRDRLIADAVKFLNTEGKRFEATFDDF